MVAVVIVVLVVVVVVVVVVVATVVVVAVAAVAVAEAVAVARATKSNAMLELGAVREAVFAVLCNTASSTDRSVSDLIKDISGRIAGTRVSCTGKLISMHLTPRAKTVGNSL